MNYPKKLLQSGQSFFEVILALALVSVILVSLVMLSAVSVRTASFAKSKNAATRLTQEAIEWLRAERDTNWSTFVTNAGTSTWCINNLNWSSPGSCGSNSFVTGTIIQRQAILSIIDASTVQARVTASWTDAQGSRQVETSTYFTKWK